MLCVKSGTKCSGCWPTLKHYDHAADKVKISPIEDCQTHELRVCTSLEQGAKSKVLISFLIVRREGEEGEEIWVQPYCCFVVVLCDEAQRAWYWQFCSTGSEYRLRKQWMRRWAVHVCSGRQCTVEKMRVM